MIGNIREILKISTAEEFLTALKQYDGDLEEPFEIIESMLDKNVMSTDVTDIEIHMALVESWRSRFSKYFSFAKGFVEHSKSSAFLMAKIKGVSTDTDRDAHRRSLSAGAEALSTRLEGTIDCIDSRVNLCKKLLGFESSTEGVRSNGNSRSFNRS